MDHTMGTQRRNGGQQGMYVGGNKENQHRDAGLHIVALHEHKRIT